MKEKNIHRIFVISLWLKAFDSFLELIGGILLLFPAYLFGITNFLITKELIEDPGDFIANHIQALLPYAINFETFGAFYLLSHAVIKLFLIVNLLRRKLWAYPLTIGVLVLFIVYQIYRWSVSPSVFLALLTLLDVIIIYLTWHEYKYMKKIHANLLRTTDKE